MADVMRGGDGWHLSAPEYLLLLRGDGRSPDDASVVRAGLVDAVIRGCLAIRQRQVPGRIHTREEWHLVVGDSIPRPPLDALVAAVEAAPATLDTEGRPGRTVAATVSALGRSGLGTYVDRHVLPALSAAGLVTDIQPPRWFRTSRFTLTAAGEAEGAAARQRVAEARRAVAAVPRRGDAEELRSARLAAAAALGGGGAVVAAERDLVRAVAELRRSGDGADVTPLLMFSTGSGVDDEERVGELYDAVDAGAFDSSSDGGFGGSSDGGGDGGGGGGGGD